MTLLPFYVFSSLCDICLGIGHFFSYIKGSKHLSAIPVANLFFFSFLYCVLLLTPSPSFNSY